MPTNRTITFGATNNWLFPTGTVWVKHFDLEMTNGSPDSRRRLETRLLVRHSGTDGSDVYGVTYRWNGSLTNATLMPEGGADEAFVIHDGGTTRTQVWRYPGRSECLLCHTRASQGGLALSFHTPQLNRDFNYGGVTDNQLRAMSHAGYFSEPITNLYSLRALARLDDESISVEQRVRSYLAANCAQCHQPGGSGWGQFDTRLFTPLSASKLIHGPLNNSSGDSSNVVVHPGRPDLSMLLTRISTLQTGSRMPPLGTSVLDTQAIALVSRWITNELTTYRTFAQWQMENFGSTTTASGLAAADPDGDDANNWAEYLTGTLPDDAGDFWKIQIERSGSGTSIRFPKIPNRIVTLEWLEEFSATNRWKFLESQGNQPVVPSTGGQHSVPNAESDNARTRHYRARVLEP